MFVVNDTDKSITMTKGDTGSVDFTLTMSGPDDPETPYAFSADDRVVWTVRDMMGQVVFETYNPIINGGFVIVFGNSDTDRLPAGLYRWDIRVVINPVWDNGRIVDGYIVATPGGPYTLTLVEPVGEV